MEYTPPDVPIPERRKGGPKPLPKHKKRVLVSAKVLPKTKRFLESLFRFCPEGHRNHAWAIDLLVKKYRDLS